MFKLRHYPTKRALRRQVKELKQQLYYQQKKIDDMETDRAIDHSLINHYKRENAKLVRKINELIDSEERTAYFPQSANPEYTEKGCNLN